MARYALSTCSAFQRPGIAAQPPPRRARYDFRRTTLTDAPQRRGVTSEHSASWSELERGELLVPRLHVYDARDRIHREGRVLVAQPHTTLHAVPIFGNLHHAGARLPGRVLVARQDVHVIPGGVRRRVADPEKRVVELPVGLRHPGPVRRGLRERVGRHVERGLEEDGANLPEEAHRWRGVVGL